MASRAREVSADKVNKVHVLDARRVVLRRLLRRQDLNERSVFVCACLRSGRFLVAVLDDENAVMLLRVQPSNLDVEVDDAAGAVHAGFAVDLAEKINVIPFAYTPNDVLKRLHLPTPHAMSRAVPVHAVTRTPPFFVPDDLVLTAAVQLQVVGVDLDEGFVEGALRLPGAPRVRLPMAIARGMLTLPVRACDAKRTVLVLAPALTPAVRVWPPSRPCRHRRTSARGAFVHGTTCSNRRAVRRWGGEVTCSTVFRARSVRSHCASIRRSSAPCRVGTHACVWKAAPGRARRSRCCVRWRSTRGSAAPRCS